MKEFILEPTTLKLSNGEEEVLSFHYREEGEQEIKVPSYHWNDRAKLLRDYNLILGLYEEYLVKVSNWLNRVHGIDYSYDYWRIIVGPWLYYFISIVFDRLESIRISSEEYQIAYSKTPKYEVKDWVPLDFIDFNNLFYSESWNAYIYSEIIKLTGFVPEKNSSHKLEREQVKDKPNRKAFIKNLLFFLTRFTRNFSKKIMMIELDLPQKSLYRLLLRLRSFSFSYFVRVRPEDKDLNIDLRNIPLDEEKSEESIKVLLDALIPFNIPKSHIEIYEEIKDQSKKIFPDKVRLVMTSNAYFSNEHFKTWIAEQKQSQTKLWVMVHGGHHGTALFNGPGKLTEDMADRFYSWGWDKFKLPSPKLSLQKKIKIKSRGKNILFIPYSVSRYSNHLDSSPIGESFYDCLKMHKRFFEKLENKDQGYTNNILFRLKSGFTPWDLEKEYYRLTGLKRFVYSDEESLIDSIKKSELVIVTYDSTVFLESLTLNVPTCLFIRKEYWEMSKASLKYFEKLHACGVLHYDESSLTNHIMTVKSNYQAWWHSNDVQDSVSYFLQKFGLSSKEWEEDWYNEIYSYLCKID